MACPLLPGLTLPDTQEDSPEKTLDQRNVNPQKYFSIQPANPTHTVGGRHRAHAQGRGYRFVGAPRRSGGCAGVWHQGVTVPSRTGLLAALNQGGRPPRGAFQPPKHCLLTQPPLQDPQGKK